jgi:ATP-binding cassette subfamily B protein/subfamily B ATP-binding cassette protein MsbA
MKPLKSSRQRFAAFQEKLRRGEVPIGGRRHGPPPPPGDEDEAPSIHRKKYLRQYRDWLWPHRKVLIGLFMLASVAAVLEMVSPAAGGILIDRVLLAEQMSRAEKMLWLNGAGIGLLLLLVIARTIEAFREYGLMKLNHRVVVELRQKLHHRMLRLSLDDLQSMKTGGIVSRLSGDVDQMTSLVQMAIISPGVACIRILVALCVLYAWNWRLALAATAILPPSIWVSIMWVRKVRPIFRAARQTRGEVDGRATETFGGIRVVRTYRREAREQHDYAVGHHTVVRKRIFARMIALSVDIVWQLLIPAISLSIIWIGGLLYLRDRATIGQIMAFQAYVVMLMWPIFRIVFSISQLQQALAAMDRVFEVLDKPLDKPDPADALPAPRTVDRMTLEDVTFAYEPGRPVLQDISLEAPGQSVVALVGPSGAGKTTLVDIIARFYDPTRGRVLLNGIDLRRFRLSDYRRMLAIVQQDVFLFDGTVFENIAYGRRGATLAEVIDAAERANADVFITQLAEGYDTLIGERGVKLSGGQRQRISIARAILADPQILILDEATSNLDTESEQLIQQALSELYRNRTTFVIAHRLSTIAHADMIVVLHTGRVVEVGRHDQLLAENGMYAQMIQRQRATMSDDLDTVQWDRHMRPGDPPGTDHGD